MYYLIIDNKLISNLFSNGNYSTTNYINAANRFSLDSALYAKKCLKALYGKEANIVNKNNLKMN